MWQVLKELILAIFYPHYCPACHEEVEGPGLLCEACRRSTYAPGYLELKKETVPHLDAVYRLYRYEGGVKRALHGLKYEKRRDYLDRMGEEVLHHEADLEPLFTGNPFVVALPTDPKRRKTRGYEIPPAIFGPYLKKHAMILTQALWRQKATKPQHGLSRAERRENLLGSFAFHPVKLDGTVIVIDDIATTGASLEEAARLLKEGGAEKVVGLVLASNAPMASVSNLD
ncbi:MULTISPECIES: ComF family protein [Acidaminococcus]|jgi:ComF family protein|uniref:ComF family protein n=1 Tax=Acidaminococcus TaxID=904 RepID=UPI001A9F66D0|nr:MULTISPECIES: phosphoribosyltransferase family protein [Acidaminococcus]